METIIIFAVLSIPIIILSWHTLFDLKSHGFYRFFSWECIAFLIAANYKFWFDNPFSMEQLISWVFLIISAYLIIVGAIVMKKKGKARSSRNEKTLYKFESTTELIDSGIFKFIRHPLYSSLLFLTWGIFFKNTDVINLTISIFSSVFLYLTAYFDEIECIQFFGEKYVDYMKRSKMFVPFVF